MIFKISCETKEQTMQVDLAFKHADPPEAKIQATPISTSTLYACISEIQVNLPLSAPDKLTSPLAFSPFKEVENSESPEKTFSAKKEKDYNKTVKQLLSEE